MGSLIVLDREQWGAREDLPRRGHRIGPVHRTEVFIHHTVIVDPDASGNTWESMEEVRAAMRTLQVIRREDLGADVPYTMVAFCMGGGDLVLCEGRGVFRTGAHTAGHNRSGLGIAFQGNFETHALPARFEEQLELLGGWLRELREERGFVKLGSRRPGGREVWGHRDVKSTLCPGQALFDRLGDLRFLELRGVAEMAMDKETWMRVQEALQALDPPLYGGRTVDGLPGQFTHAAVRAFERRVGLQQRGVIGTFEDPQAEMWPATREMLFARAS